MGSVHSHAQSMWRSRHVVDNGQRRCAKELLDVAQGCRVGAKGGGLRRAGLGGCPRTRHPARVARSAGGCPEVQMTFARVQS